MIAAIKRDMRNNIYQGRKILITGASSGIGLEFARILCRYDCTLILAASRFKQIEDVKESLLKIGVAKILFFRIDLSKIGCVKDFCIVLEKEDLIPDILINSAGRQNYGYFHNLDWEEQSGQITLNCIAPIYLMHEIIPHMLRKNFGKILNVSSVAGTMPGPFFATYAATKAFFNSFSQAINAELSNKNIHCACLLPGKTNCKNFWDIQNLRGKLGDICKFASPSDVARYGLKLLEKNNDYGVFGLHNKIIQLIKQFTPRRVLIYALRKHSYSSELLRDKRGR